MYKLLVIDDEIDVCDFVKTFFEDRGFKVLTALNGTEGVSIANRERPDLILLDIKMKGIDGISALRQIKELFKEARVLMVTAMDDQERMSESNSLGALGYVTKPLILENLEELVMRNLKLSDNNKDNEQDKQ